MDRAKENQFIEESGRFGSVDGKYLYLFKTADWLPDLEDGQKASAIQVKDRLSAAWFEAVILRGCKRLQSACVLFGRDLSCFGISVYQVNATKAHGDWHPNKTPGLSALVDKIHSKLHSILPIQQLEAVCS